MIKGIFIFNTDYETILTRIYCKSISIKSIISVLKSNNDSNFIDLNSNIIVYKQYDDSIICFVANEENEMHILALITVLMNTIERMLGSLNHKSLIYHFKDTYAIVDNFVLNGVVIGLNPADILSSLEHTQSIIDQNNQ
ncbi:uncharacterized protein VICG_01504 [Vittaforma corneae ATCC 50505]|uniref:AP complex mu/sigma subunit domain-containing protein n=1 Tax=Vittaforma corneae (strain ATCC 50505) TaxID=993615 RepID=L2GL79_VITCO|nr:uncharacterized protein VICG_01504 [Vittaforma corneae ATCC 50505]ELA41399.1 hypothetical protein VICG_01504 [Vittaforma corneae ATCC 50505]